MHYPEFVGRVNERIRAGRPGEVEYAIKDTLATLGEHLTGREAEDLGARLPAELQAQFASGNYAEAAKDFSAAEFHRRVAERGRLSQAEEGAGHAWATAQAASQAIDRDTIQAVLAVLSEAVGSVEFFADAPSRLPRETTPLSDTGDLLSP